MNSKFLHFCLIMIILSFAACKKDQDNSVQDQILGTWISMDNSDTLYFAGNNNLWKPHINGVHFDYKLINDSIRIGYRDRCYIYVLPTTHKYYLEGNNLTIDFSNKRCFGFAKRVMDYIRKTD
jgi:hypothetical protein